MRVIGGSARGRRLVVPAGHDVRPTSDRVREALFSSLGDRVLGAYVLDLFAGSGALAIEALSRGADRAVLVERNPRALAVIRQNLRRAGVADRARVRAGGAAAAVRDPGPEAPFDLVFCDPPYDQPVTAVHELLAVLQAGGGLVDGAVVVIERDRRDPGWREPPTGLAVDRERTYGDTVLRFLTAVSAPASEETP